MYVLIMYVLILERCPGSLSEKKQGAKTTCLLTSLQVEPIIKFKEHSLLYTSLLSKGEFRQ